jgi:hypothetical protein
MCSFVNYGLRSLNVVFFKKMVGTNPSIMFDDKENYDQKDKKKGLCGC